MYITYMLIECMNHSEWQKLLQVMKGSRRNPLTPGRWVHMGLKNDSFENFWPRYLTYQFSKNKNLPIKSQKIRVEGKVPHNFAHLMMVFTKIRS